VRHVNAGPRIHLYTSVNGGFRRFDVNAGINDSIHVSKQHVAAFSCSGPKNSASSQSE
jgi:hypothetical protein